MKTLFILPLLFFCVMSSIAQQTKAPIGGIRIAWDYHTLVKVSSNNARYSGYARLIKLADKSLICVYEAGGIYCVKSYDEGMTWSNQTLVAANVDHVNMAVPDILQLKDSSLLVCYNPRPSRRPVDTTKHFAIKTKKSYDGGKTWTDERTLYEADYRFENGCWEPSAIQLPNGDIELFFANESSYRQSNEQCISMVKSKDSGLSWSTAKTTSFRPHSRDGMPSPILLQNGKEMVYSIEDNGFKNFKPTIIRSTLKDDWAKPVGADDANRNFALIDKVPDSLYLGAPYLRQLKTGETILSYQGTEDRINNMNHSEMKVVIGDSEARNFDRKTVPFNIAGDKSGLWNSVSVLDEYNIAALTSTSSFSVNNNAEVWMIQGHIIPELHAYNKKFTVDGKIDADEWGDDVDVFIGQKGRTRLSAGTAYDSKYLYVYAKVDDRSTAQSGVEIYLDPQNKHYVSLGKGIYKITISGDNKMSFYRGDSGNWVAENGADMKWAVRNPATGYVVETAIPWTLIGGKPALHKRLGFNMALVSSLGYTENISANEADKPFTWCTLALY